MTRHVLPCSSRGESASPIYPLSSMCLRPNKVDGHCVSPFSVRYLAPSIAGLARMRAVCWKHTALLFFLQYLSGDAVHGDNPGIKKAMTATHRGILPESRAEDMLDMGKNRKSRTIGLSSRSVINVILHSLCSLSLYSVSLSLFML